MANMSVPIDGRPQFSFLDLALNNVQGRGPTLDQVQQIGADRYIQPNAWPKPKPSPTTNSGFSGLAASPTPVEVPKGSSKAAKALWPALP
jgi:hypothetical protein